MNVQNNPAGRLHDILRLAQEQHPNHSARDAWGKVFEVSPADTGSLLKMLADLINLVHETKKSIGRLDDVNHEIHLRPFAKIETLLSQINLEAPWSHSRSQIDEPMLYGLQFSADRLSRISDYTQISSEELAELRTQIEEISTHVSASNTIPLHLKLLLLRNLEAIRYALIAYRIRGIDGLQVEIERSVGSLFIHQAEIETFVAQPEQPKHFQEFYALVDRLNKVVTLARSTKELAVPALQFFKQLLLP